MSGWLSLAITVILVVVAYLILNRNINSRTSQQAALDEIKHEVGAIITELNQTTERNVELLEDRIETLERLIAQADKRLGALRRDLSARQSEEVTYSRLGNVRRRDTAGASPTGGPEAVRGAESEGSPGDTGDDPTTGKDRRTGEDRRADGGRSSTAGRESTGGDDSRPGQGSHADERPAVGGGVTAQPSVRERVRTLYLQGLTLERIASIVGKTVGEVELIVSLEEGAQR